MAEDPRAHTHTQERKVETDTRSEMLPSMNFFWHDVGVCGAGAGVGEGERLVIEIVILICDGDGHDCRRTHGEDCDGEVVDTLCREIMVSGGYPL